MDAQSLHEALNFGFVHFLNFLCHCVALLESREKFGDLRTRFDFDDTCRIIVTRFLFCRCLANLWFLRCLAYLGFLRCLAYYWFLRCLAYYWFLRCLAYYWFSESVIQSELSYKVVVALGALQVLCIQVYQHV